MLNNNTINILKKNIEKHGIEISFKRKPKNAYGEIDNNADFSIIATIRGIFHESNNFFNAVITTDKGSVETKKTPAILTAFENKALLQKDDICDINGTQYRIASFYDADLSNKFVDISLELIWNG